jgi:hypothetical protein
VTAHDRRPGAPSGPSANTAQGIGEYVTEVLTLLADERDIYRDALTEIAKGEWDDPPWPYIYAQEALRRGRLRS